MTDPRPGRRRLLHLLAATLITLLGVLVVLPGTASAASNSISASVTAGGPTYTHLSAVPGNPCAAGSVTTHYSLISAKLVGPSASTLTITLNPSGFTGNIGIYQGGFLPDLPIVNCFGNVAGTGSGAAVTYSTPLGALLPGFTEQTFYIVVAGQNASDLGNFSLTVNSTAATSVVMANETPTTTPDTTAPVLSLPANITAEATGPSGRVVTYTASANDAVDGSRPVTCTPASGSTFAITTTTVNCSATDTSGNTRNGSFTVKIQDTTGPNITYNGMASWQATSAAGAAVTYIITSTDIVDGTRPSSCTPASGATFPLGTSSISCSSTDTRGNTSTATFSVNVVDTAGPVLSLPANITAEATGPTGRTVTYTATANDAVLGSRPVTCTPASGSTFAIATTTVNCSSSDGTNTSNGSFTVKVQDTTAPTLTLPSPITVQATGGSGATATYTATATDLVDGSVTVSCNKASGSTFAVGTTTVACTATDAHSNQGTGSFTVTVVDSTGPVLSLPANITKEATGPTGATATFTATATDAVDGPRPVTCTPASGATFALGTTTVNCSATDLNSNTTNGSFTVTVQDTTAPALNLPANIVNEATGPTGATATFSATAADLVNGPRPVTCTPTSGATFPIGVTTVNCSATDLTAHTATGSFTVTVVDSTAPVLTLPSNITTEATGPTGAPVSYTATAADIVDGARTVTCLPASGTTFAIGTTTVNCSASDTRGNEKTGSFTVTVADTVGPVLTLPVDFSREATGPSGAVVTYAATATDVVDGAVTPICSPASGSTFGLVTTTVVCTATDDADNESTSSFKVTVVDTTAPVITAPTDLTEEATGPTGTVVTFTASATDLVDGAVTTACLPASGSTFAIGTTTVTCTASDSRNNEGTETFEVTISDTTGPVLALPADITEEATASTGAPVSFTATAADLVDGTVDVTCTPASGAVFALGTTTVNCAASDAEDNETTGTFTVTVVDTTAPTLDLPDDIVIEAAGPDGTAVNYAATATDLVDGTDPVTCDVVSGSVFAIGTATVECTSVDEAGNDTSGTFTVTVQDTTGPVAELPADQVVEATGPDGATVDYTVSATDLVDGDSAISCVPASGSVFPIGDTEVNCETADLTGNVTTGTFTVTVQDTTAPVIEVPEDITVDAAAPDGTEVSFTATATDVVNGDVPVTCTPESGSVFPVGTTTVTCTASDPDVDTAPPVVATSVRAKFALVRLAADPPSATADFTVTVRTYVPPTTSTPPTPTTATSTTGSSTTATSTTGSTTGSSTTGSTTGSTASPTVAPTSGGGSGGLPNTGVNVGPLLAISIALLLAGVVLLRLPRTGRRH